MSIITIYDVVNNYAKRLLRTRSLLPFLMLWFKLGVKTAKSMLPSGCASYDGILPGGQIGYQEQNPKIQDRHHCYLLIDRRAWLSMPAWWNYSSHSTERAHIADSTTRHPDTGHQHEWVECQRSLASDGERQGLVGCQSGWVRYGKDHECRLLERGRSGSRPAWWEPDCLHQPWR